MGIKRVLGAGFFGGLSPKRLLGTNQLKSQAATVKEVYKATLKPRAPKVSNAKSFDELLRQNHVTEGDLKKIIHNKMLVVYACLGVSAATTAYMFYQFASGLFSGGLLCLSMTFILWTLSFREHFIVFQMRERRLSATLKEWLSSLLTNKKNNSKGLS